MKPTLIIIGSAFAFAVLGLIAAFGFSYFPSNPSSPRPEMFVILPPAGAAIGWFIAYLATPFDDKEDSRRASSDQHRNAA